jgi:uncharacterized protein YjbJ (UPF0337 family)
MADNTRKTGDENRAEGTAKELGGKIRGGLGDLVDDREQHVKGTVDELKGKAQKNLGKVQQKVEDLDRNR